MKILLGQTSKAKFMSDSPANKANQQSSSSSSYENSVKYLTCYPRNYYINKSHISFAGASMDDQIAGYAKQKCVLIDEFIRPIIMERQGMYIGSINPIMIFGLVGTGKSTFARSLADQSECHLNEINPSPERFCETVMNLMNEARYRYNEKGQRTIISLDNPERYLSDDPENRDNVQLMKYLLDFCSNLPGDKHDPGFATTILYTTNNPMRISYDLIRRKSRMHLITLGPAEGEDLKAVLKHYVKKEFDYDTDIDYDKLAEILKPDMEKGAFSNDKIRHIVQRAAESYYENKDVTFEEHLLQRALKSKADITPRRLEQYYEDLKNFRGEES